MLTPGMAATSSRASPHYASATIDTSVEGDHVSLAVSDTGEGMEPAAMDSIFDAFFTTKSGGSGLGLAVTRAIVEDHHGEIHVRSQMGAGTTFTIELQREPT